ncbi:hypothetical protein CWB99_00275 [Pseudoalteromonas rubra]|uniref:Lipoprotein n=1 Tax=Pseudoalteromonas rubra TaxID=43658 RepID=A0A5S3WVT7_9GAMM|nr:hypothetical protein [Pseudoalteromonas rubra]TMP31796.1 hypothetical protein CWC00_14360 [Pseudoalteromonas rubra]TMP33121.1 hypothetical protein CWB99_00275 [Pseudoalteromonas rubra]
MKPLIFVMLVLLSACSSVPQAPMVNSELPKVTYKGRGAAAGPMLVGAMGPVGIAVGFAIDEGIAKEIGSALKESQVQGEKELANVIAEQFPEASSVKMLSLDFKAQRGNDDFAFATVELRFRSKEDEWQLCLQTNPGDLSALKEASLGWSLIVESISANRVCKESQD